jgi:hypothetical protein
MAPQNVEVVTVVELITHGDNMVRRAAKEPSGNKT